MFNRPNPARIIAAFLGPKIRTLSGIATRIAKQNKATGHGGCFID